MAIGGCRWAVLPNRQHVQWEGFGRGRRGHENRYRYSGSGRANQEWQFVQLPYFQIVSKASGQVLDVYAAQTNQGTPVDIAQAVVGAPNQEWMLVAAGTPLPPACSQSVGG